MIYQSAAGLAEQFKARMNTIGHRPRDLEVAQYVWQNLPREDQQQVLDVCGRPEERPVGLLHQNCLHYVAGILAAYSAMRRPPETPPM